jgi:hypothetical protein
MGKKQIMAQPFFYLTLAGRNLFQYLNLRKRFQYMMQNGGNYAKVK